MLRNVAVLATDADNTLWDTDSVFASAQLALLARVETLAGVEVRSTDRLAFVRHHDQTLAATDPRGLKYPAAQLVRALWHQVCPELESVALSDGDVASLVDEYDRDLRATPQVRPGVLEGLHDIFSSGVAVWVFSEGRPETVQRNLMTHRIDRFVARTVYGVKNARSFASLREGIGPSDFGAFVGDQLDRDIEPAKSAGFTTFYFPGTFRPAWFDQNLEQFADYTVGDFREVALIVNAAAVAVDFRPKSWGSEDG